VPGTTNAAAKKWLTASTRALHELAAMREPSALPWMRIRANAYRVAFAEHVSAESWSGLRTAARSQQRESSRALDAMMREQARLSPIAAAVLNPPRAVVRALDVQHRPNWHTLRRHVQEEWEQAGVTGAELAERMQSLDATTAATTVAAVSAPVTHRVSHLDSLSVAHRRALAAGRLARAVTEFNTAAPTRPRGDADSVAQALQEHVDALLHEVWSAAHRGRDKAARTAASELAGAADSAQFTAALRRAAYLVGQDDPARDDTVGGSLLALADALRMALQSAAIGDTVTWLLGWPGRSGADLVCGRARQLPLTVAADETALVAIGDMHAKPASYDGQRVRLRGWLRDVTFDIKRGGESSSGAITDAAGTSVRLRLDHVRLDGGGATNGCYAEVVGSVHGGSRPVVVPELRDPRTTARTSWLGWARQATRACYLDLPFGLCVRPSWAKGRDGAGNPLRYAMWFS
jgi:hypothetical protein